MTAKYTEILSALRRCQLVAVLTIENIQHAGDLAVALERAGITVAEVTLRTSCALAAIKAMKRSAPNLIIGAGTIVTKTDIRNAIDVGSDFLVTPATDEYLCKALKEMEIPVFPGVATASEALKLYRHGFEYLKFFPADSNGGVKALRSLAAPLPQIKFMPTGGINGNTINDYLACPNVIAVGGSWMIDDEVLVNASWEGLIRSITLAIDAMDIEPSVS